MINFLQSVCIAFEEKGMPDLTIDEADRCPYCDKVLRDPPICCDEAKDNRLDRLLKEIMPDKKDSGPYCAD
jgi:hypothetical protein